MPTYSYQCQYCKKTFDLFLKMKDNDKPTLEPCPYCSNIKVIQIITHSNPFGDPYSLGLHRLPDSWRNFLKEVKNKNPGSNINV